VSYNISPCQFQWTLSAELEDVRYVIADVWGESVMTFPEYEVRSLQRGKKIEEGDQVEYLDILGSCEIGRVTKII
jgi:hypothetical protein